MARKRPASSFRFPFVKMLASFLIAALLLMQLPLQAAASGSDNKTETFRYVISSDETVETAATFQSAITAYYTASSYLSGTKLYYDFTSAQFNFYPINDSDVPFGFLSYDASVSCHVSESIAQSGFDSSITPPASFDWSGKSSYLRYGFGFSGDAVISYLSVPRPVVSSNDLSLTPTGDSDSFSIFLVDAEGGSPSFSGTQSYVGGSLSIAAWKDRISWSYGVSGSGSWNSSAPSYWLVGSESDMEFGPFEYGVEYQLSDVPSWATERFRIKSVLTLNGSVSASAVPYSEPFYPSSVQANSSSGYLNTYRNYTLSMSVSPLYLTIDVVFPGNKEISDYLQEIIDGYDNSQQTGDNQRFEDSRQELQEEEDSLFNDAMSEFGDLDMDDYSIGKFAAMQAAFSFVSGFLQSLYVQMGDFGSIVTIGLVLLIASLVIGLYKYQVIDHSG